MDETAIEDRIQDPQPGDVAEISMMGREPVVALFDGLFWRSCDSRGPVKCVQHAVVTSRLLVAAGTPTHHTTEEDTP